MFSRVEQLSWVAGNFKAFVTKEETHEHDDDGPIDCHDSDIGVDFLERLLYQYAANGGRALGMKPKFKYRQRVRARQADR